MKSENSALEQLRKRKKNLTLRIIGVAVVVLIYLAYIIHTIVDEHKELHSYAYIPVIVLAIYLFPSLTALRKVNEQIDDIVDPND